MGEAEAFYFRYWGKAKPCAEGGQPYHLLVYHSLDVAAVASVWWDQSLPIQDSFMQYAAGLSREQMKAWVIFFIALHDYGKFDIRFQRKAPEAWTLLQNNFVGSDELPTPHDCKTYDHGSAGIYWYINDYIEDVEQDLGEDWLLQIETLVEDKPDDLWLAWIKSVAGHHGYVYPPKTNPDEFKCKLSLCVSSEIKTQDQIARQQWFKELERILLQPVGLSLEDKPPIPSPLLAGFCSVADWLGSRSDEVNFRYKADPVDDLGSDYFGQRCLEDAPRVLALSGINGTAKTFNGVSALLQGYKPRQLQTLVDQLPADPGLTIVEAPTGSGKTEMAMAYAWRLITENHADSIVFAMPTQATANAMMPRLEKLATTLFEDHPNLILAHGHARFNADFLTLKETWKTAQGKDEAWVHCSEWLGQSRKRIFLGQIGVCTIDQVLVSVLPVKHRFVRGFGVGRSVLVVDEIHSYSAYMYGLLEAVLREQYNAGGSSLLLSATLNKQLRGDLLATYGEPIESETDSLPYPLISWSNKKTVCSYTLPEEELPPERQVKIECSLNDDLLPDESLQERIIAAAEQGAQVAIICNLVDVAQRLARDLQVRTVLPVDIFHARYCLHHRTQKEKAVLDHYGTEGKRLTGRILVATQVIESSVDIDMDWMITQLCPVDLLFQRMGRLHRHQRFRPAGFETPLCTVLLPEGTDYKTHGLIYNNTRVMWRTVQKLLSCPDNKLLFPAAYRKWIEPIYSEEAWGTEPEEVEVGYEKFKDELLGKQILAQQMLRWAEDVALQDDDEKISAVTRDGEFNLSVIPYLDTPAGRQLLDGTVFETLKEDWQRAEALTMNTVGVPKGWKKSLPDEDDEQRVWLAMDSDSETWRATYKRVEFSYNPVWGMEKSA